LDAVETPVVTPTAEADAADNAKRIKFSKKHLQFVVEAMNQVVNAPNGTAHGARISTPGMEMGGKTGTAQVRRITMAERATGVIKNENLPWKYRDHALFIGFAPVDKPKYVAAVVIEHGGGGSAVAAPIARDLLREAQKRDPELAAKAAAIAKPA
jgi:penicillin-binding protein 2